MTKTNYWHDGFGKNNFDFLRFLFALMVLVSHAFVLTLGDDESTPDTDDFEPIFQLTNGVLTLGDFAVDGFFIISGFLIAHSYLRSKTLLTYLFKRILRIYPGFIIATILSMVAAFFSNGLNVFSLSEVLKSIGQMTVLIGYGVEGAFVSNPFPAVNGSMWTIQYEFWCYIWLMLGGILGFLKRPNIVIGALVFFIIAAFCVYFFHLRVGLGKAGIVLGYPPFWPRLLSYFFAGVTFYLLRERIPHSTSLALISFFLFCISLMSTSTFILFAPILLTYLILWVAYHPKLKFNNFAINGDFSYGIYLYAFPIQQLLIYNKITLTPLENIFVALPLTVLAGFLSWHLVEKRFLLHREHHRGGGGIG